jgi:hypothetical protein
MGERRSARLPQPRPWRYGLPDDGIHAEGAWALDFAVLSSVYSAQPFVVLPAPGSLVLTDYPFRDRNLSFAYSFGDAPGTYDANLLVGDADRDGETDLVIPQTVGGDGITTRIEAAFFRSYGGTRTGYYRGEWRRPATSRRIRITATISSPRPSATGWSRSS